MHCTVQSTSHPTLCVWLQTCTVHFSLPQAQLSVFDYRPALCISLYLTPSSLCLITDLHCAFLSTSGPTLCVWLQTCTVHFSLPQAQLSVFDYRPALCISLYLTPNSLCLITDLHCAFLSTSGPTLCVWLQTCTVHFSLPQAQLSVFDYRPALCIYLYLRPNSLCLITDLHCAFLSTSHPTLCVWLQTCTVHFSLPHTQLSVFDYRPALCISLYLRPNSLCLITDLHCAFLSTSGPTLCVWLQTCTVHFSLPHTQLSVFDYRPALCISLYLRPNSLCLITDLHCAFLSTSGPTLCVWLQTCTVHFSLPHTQLSVFDYRPALCISLYLRPNSLCLITDLHCAFLSTSGPTLCVWLQTCTVHFSLPQAQLSVFDYRPALCISLYLTPNSLCLITDLHCAFLSTSHPTLCVWLQTCTVHFSLPQAQLSAVSVKCLMTG